MRYLFSFFIFSFYLYGFNYYLKPYEISKGINCFFGLPSQIDKANGGNMINSCYIETSDGYVVIDSGPTYSYAQEAYSVMQKKKKLPVKYVINTSWKEVHVLGNEFYKELGAKLMAPKGYKKHIEHKKILSLSKKVTADALLNTRIIPVDTYIEKNETLIFKKIKIEIKTLENDDNYLYIYIKDKDIIFTGDLIFNNRIVLLDNERSLLSWIKELNKLTALKWSDMISAHGYMTRRSALKNTKSYLSLLNKRVTEEIKNKKSRKEVINNVKLLAFEDDKFYDIWHQKNVANAYDELVLKINTNKKNKIENENNNSKIKKTEEVKPKKTDKSLAENNDTKLIVDKEEIIYKNFDEAIKIAKTKNKIVLIKVRSTLCRYCDQLDRIIEKNSNVQNILNKYFEVVKINIDNDDVPMNLTIRSTPTLIFVRPNDKKVLMQLVGIRALGELLEILNEAVDDGHMGGYLKP